jgi:hypothetical protein
MVIVHSEPPLIWLALFVAAGSALLLLLCAILVVLRNFRLAKRIARTTVAVWVVWVVVANGISLLTPRTIVKIGETYCWDINCLGIDEVIPPVQASDGVYKLNVHVYSDANTIKISFKNFSPFLVDERGRRFPMVLDTSVTPYDSLLDPRQTIKTSLTFKVAPDARQLFLTVEVTGPQEHVGGKTGPAPFWAPFVGLALYGGGGYFVQKEALLRVL